MGEIREKDVGRKAVGGQEEQQRDTEERMVNNVLTLHVFIKQWFGVKFLVTEITTEDF